MQPYITILIPTKNVAPYIDQVLRSVFNLDYPKDRFDVWILDGYSTDGTQEILKKYPVIVRESVWNVPKFYNSVLDEIKGEIVALGDGDAIVESQWLKVLVRYFDDPKVGGAGGLCLTANSEHIVPRVIGYELKARYERMPSSISRIATMNVLYRKKALFEVGKFDERFDTGYDTDIGHRICAAGYKIAYDPKAIVYHYNRPTLRSYFRQQLIYGKNVANLYIHHLHIAKGDEITPFWMNIQPFLFLLVGLSFLISLVFPITAFFGIAILLLLLIGFTASAINLTIREKDPSGLYFVILCFVRGVAWTFGGFWFVLLLLKKATGYSQSQGGSE